MGALDRLEHSFKAIGAGAGLIYALGFLVINVYLAKFGVREFQLFSAQFISAGIVMMIILLSPFLIFWIALKSPGIKYYQNIIDYLKQYIDKSQIKIETAKKQNRNRTLILILNIRKNIFVAVVCILFVCITFVVVELSTRMTITSLAYLGGLDDVLVIAGLRNCDWKHPMNVLSYCGTIIWLGYYFIAYNPKNGPSYVNEYEKLNDQHTVEELKRPAEGEEQEEHQEVEKPAVRNNPQPEYDAVKGFYMVIQGFLILLLIIVGTLVGISRNLYPLIPQSVGGGRPIPVILQFDGEKDDIPICIPMRSQGSHTSLPVGLISESEDSVLVLLKHQNDAETVVRINRSNLRAIHYLPLNTDLNMSEQGLSSCDIGQTT